MNPNEVLGSTSYETWLSPDWTTEEDKQKSGYTKVKIQVVQYRDGRKVRYVLDTAGKPVSQVGTVEYDKDVKAVWDKAVADAKQTERKVTRTYTGVDPRTGKPAIVTEYESGPPKYDEIKTGADSRTPEAKQGQEQDEYERQANAADPASGRRETNIERKNREEKERKEAEAKAEREKQQARPPGGRAEIVEGGKRKGWNPETGAYDKDLGPAPAKPVVGTPRQDPETGKWWQTVTDSETGTTSWREVAGGPPAPAKEPKTVTIDGEVYSVTKNAAGEDVLKRMPVEGEKPPDTGGLQPTFKPGQVVAGLRDYAKGLDDLVAAGKITSSQRAKLWTAAKEMAEVSLAESRETGATDRQRMQVAATGFNQALDFVSNLNKFLPQGSDLGGKAFIALLGLQQMFTQSAAPQAPAGGGLAGSSIGLTPSLGTLDTTTAAPPSGLAPGAVTSASDPSLPAPGAPAVSPEVGGPLNPGSQIPFQQPPPEDPMQTAARDAAEAARLNAEIEAANAQPPAPTVSPEPVQPAAIAPTGPLASLGANMRSVYDTPVASTQEAPVAPPELARLRPLFEQTMAAPPPIVAQPPPFETLAPVEAAKAQAFQGGVDETEARLRALGLDEDVILASRQSWMRRNGMLA